MKMKMKSFWGIPTNSFYDRNKSFDGGGYWQYKGGALFVASSGRFVTMEVCDNSCGGFGSRKEFHATVGDRVFDKWWGTMKEIGYCDPTCKDLKPLCSAARINVTEARKMIDMAFEAANAAARRAWKNRT